MIDTHAHLYDAVFEADFQQVESNLRAAGVEQVWLPNCDSQTLPALLACSGARPDAYLPMMGLHPCYVKPDTLQSELQLVADMLEQHPERFRAVGEIGLDYYWDVSFTEEQKTAFVTQLSLAALHGLPVSIHCRNAFADTAALIETHAVTGQKGIFHCFMGNLQEAQRAISLGFLLGIGGVATFKNGGLDAVLPHIPLRHLVLETDAPYLAPVPFRGKRNEPAYLAHIAQRIADVKQVSVEEVARQTSENARQLLSSQK